MRYLRSCCFTLLCLGLPALSSCTATIAVANTPPDVALASCTLTANPIDMVPSRLTLPTAGWKYRIVGVHVIGSNWQDNPPPISASELRTALRRAVHQAGLSESRGASRLPGYILLAQIISQPRLDTPQNSREQLVVYYSLIPQNGADPIMRNVTISTVADIHDWANAPCARLSELQEKLTRDSIRHMFGELIDSQG